MSTDVTKPVDDALQRRIARFVADTPVQTAVNSYLWLSAGTDLGQARKDNQDRAIAITASYSYAPERNFTLAVVCDGIGGMAYGAEAAALALSTFASQVIRTTTVPPAARLERALCRANEAVNERFYGNGGTTLSAVLMTDDLATFCVNAGDSRVYGISRDRSLVPLTRDDTLGAYQKNSASKPTGYEARLIQFVGMGEYFEPQVEKFLRDEYSAIFISSDGIHSAPSEVLETIAEKTPDAIKLTKKLLELSRLLGGRDNATIVCIDGKIQHRPPAEPGLTLVLLSPFDRLEVWMPTPSHEQKSERSQDAPEKASDEDSDAITTRERYLKRRRAKPRRKTSLAEAQNNLRFGKPSTNQTDKADPQESDRPEVDIKFPTDNQG